MQQGIFPLNWNFLQHSFWINRPWKDGWRAALICNKEKDGHIVSITKQFTSFALTTVTLLCCKKYYIIPDNVNLIYKFITELH